MTEKRINNFLNLWLRCPGCIAHTTLTVVGFNMLEPRILTVYDRYT